MANREPEAGWCAVVEGVHGKPIEAYGLREALDHTRDVFEGVFEFLSRRHIGLTEAGKVRRDEMKSVVEQRNEVTEHVARGREAVQQQELRRVAWPRLAIKNLETVRVGRSVSDGA